MVWLEKVSICPSSETRVVESGGVELMNAGFLYVRTLLVPFELNEVRRRIDGSKEFVLYSEGFLYVRTMPSPSNKARVDKR